MFMILTLIIWPIQNDAKKPLKNDWNLGTHPRELSESFPMNTYMTGFKWMKVASALEG